MSIKKTKKSTATDNENETTVAESVTGQVKAVASSGQHSLLVKQHVDVIIVCRSYNPGNSKKLFYRMGQFRILMNKALNIKP